MTKSKAGRPRIPDADKAVNLSLSVPPEIRDSVERVAAEREQTKSKVVVGILQKSKTLQ